MLCLTMADVTDDLPHFDTDDPLVVPMQDQPLDGIDDEIDLENEPEDEGEGEETEGSNPVNRKRKLTSPIYDHYEKIELADGNLKLICKYCKKVYIKTGSTTTQYKRHIEEYCSMRPNVSKRQQVLDLRQGLGAGQTTIVTNFKYDQSKVRESIAHFILMHDHPFSVVEQVGFILMMKMVNPLFQKISRITAKSDCMAVYESEKKRLKLLLTKISKISLTTDCWKSSSQQIEYMVVTGHFIDSDWVLQKRVLSFVHVPPPRAGVDLANALFKCIHEWGIESKVFSISVDNASYNDVVIKIMKRSFLSSGKLVLNGDLFHVRCCAHILNILVQDGLKEIKDIIHNIRESVKFLKYSEARMQKFCEVVQQLKLSGRKLVLDT